MPDRRQCGGRGHPPMPACGKLFLDNRLWLRCRAGSQRRVRRQHSSRCVTVRARWRHQRGQPLHELQRAHHPVCLAVSPRRLQLERQLPRGVALCPVVEQGRAGDGAAHSLQSVAIVCFDLHGRVKADPPKSTHRRWRAIAPRRAKTFRLARGPNAMRQVMAAARRGRRVRASSPSALGSASPGAACWS